MKFRIFLLCLCLIIQTQGGFSQKSNCETPRLIPKPQKEIYSNLFLRLPSVITISNDIDVNAKSILEKALLESLNIEVSYNSNENSLIRFFVDKQLPDEAYHIKIDTVHIDIHASAVRLKEILTALIIRDGKQSTEDLSDLRRQIDELDDQLLELLAKRMRISCEIGTFKKEHNLTVVQTDRYDEILQKRIAQATSMSMNPDFMRVVLEAIHEESVRQQVEILNK